MSFSHDGGPYLNYSASAWLLGGRRAHAARLRDGLLAAVAPGRRVRRRAGPAARPRGARRAHRRRRRAAAQRRRRLRHRGRDHPLRRRERALPRAGARARASTSRPTPSCARRAPSTTPRQPACSVSSISTCCGRGTSRRSAASSRRTPRLGWLGPTDGRRLRAGPGRGDGRAGRAALRPAVRRAARARERIVARAARRPPRARGRGGGPPVVARLADVAGAHRARAGGEHRAAGPRPATGASSMRHPSSTTARRRGSSSTPAMPRRSSRGCMRMRFRLRVAPRDASDEYAVVGGTAAALATLSPAAPPGVPLVWRDPWPAVACRRSRLRADRAAPRRRARLARGDRDARRGGTAGGCRGPRRDRARRPASRPTRSASPHGAPAGRTRSTSARCRTSRLAPHRRAPQQGLLPRTGDRRQGAQPRAPAAPARRAVSSTAATTRFPVPARPCRWRRRRRRHRHLGRAALRGGPDRARDRRGARPPSTRRSPSTRMTGRSPRRRRSSCRPRPGRQHPCLASPACPGARSRNDAPAGERSASPQAIPTGWRARIDPRPRPSPACGTPAIPILQIVVAATARLRRSRTTCSGIPSPLLAATVTVGEPRPRARRPPARRARDGARDAGGHPGRRAPADRRRARGGGRSGCPSP